MSKRKRKFHRKWNQVSKAIKKEAAKVAPIKLYVPPKPKLLFPERMLLPGEVSRTEYRQLELMFTDPPPRVIDLNTHCHYCKNQDTQRIVDTMSLAPFVEHYRDMNFRAFSCYCCGSVWSHAVQPLAARLAA